MEVRHFTGVVQRVITDGPKNTVSSSKADRCVVNSHVINQMDTLNTKKNEETKNVYIK